MSRFAIRSEERRNKKERERERDGGWWKMVAGKRLLRLWFRWNGRGEEGERRFLSMLITGANVNHDRPGARSAK